MRSEVEAIRFDLKTPLKRCQLDEEPETRSTPESDDNISRVLYFSFEESEECESLADSIKSPSLYSPEERNFFKRQNILSTPIREEGEESCERKLLDEQHNQSTAAEKLTLTRRRRKTEIKKHRVKPFGFDEDPKLLTESKLSSLGSLNFDSVFDSYAINPENRKIRKRLFFNEDNTQAKTKPKFSQKVVFAESKNPEASGLKMLKFSSIPELDFQSQEPSQNSSESESCDIENQDNLTIFSEADVEPEFFESPIKALEDLSGVKSKIPSFELLFQEDDKGGVKKRINFGETSAFKEKVSKHEAEKIEMGSENNLRTPILNHDTKIDNCGGIRGNENFAKKGSQIEIDDFNLIPSEFDFKSENLKSNDGLKNKKDDFEDINFPQLPCLNDSKQDFLLNSKIEKNIQPKDDKLFETIKNLKNEEICNFKLDSKFQNLSKICLNDFQIETESAKNKSKNLQKSNYKSCNKVPNPENVENLDLTINCGRENQNQLTDEGSANVSNENNFDLPNLSLLRNQIVTNRSENISTQNSESLNMIDLPCLSELRNEIAASSAENLPNNAQAEGNISSLSNMLNDLQFTDSLMCSEAEKTLINILPSAKIISIKLNSNSKFLAISASNKKVYIFDIDSGAVVFKKSFATSVTALDFWGENILATGDKMGVVKIFDIKKSRFDLIVALQVHNNSPVCKLLFSEDGVYLASSGLDNRVYLMQLHQISERLYNDEDTPEFTRSKKFTRNRHPANLRFESARKGKRKPRIAVNLIAKFDSTPKALAWHPVRLRTLFIGGGVDDRHIRVYDIPSRKMIIEKETESQISSLFFSQDGLRLVSAHGFPNNDLKIWGVDIKRRNLELRQVLVGHEKRVLHMGLSPCGNMVVTGSADETLRVWEVFPSRKERKFVARDFRKSGFSCIR